MKILTLERRGKEKGIIIFFISFQETMIEEFSSDKNKNGGLHRHYNLFNNSFILRTNGYYQSNLGQSLNYIGYKGIMSLGFLKRCFLWREDIINLFHDFHNGNLDVSRINYGIITLLPKLAQIGKRKCKGYDKINWRIMPSMDVLDLVKSIISILHLYDEIFVINGSNNTAHFSYELEDKN
ncbi:hypothetical protein ACJX0J_021989 [Zea mays]